MPAKVDDGAVNAIGVDVEGTKMAAGVVTSEGEILNEVRYPTADDPERLVRSIARSIQEVRDGTKSAGFA